MLLDCTDREVMVSRSGQKVLVVTEADFAAACLCGNDRLDIEEKAGWTREIRDQLEAQFMAWVKNENIYLYEKPRELFHPWLEAADEAIAEGCGFVYLNDLS